MNWEEQVQTIAERFEAMSTKHIEDARATMKDASYHYGVAHTAEQAADQLRMLLSIAKSVAVQ